MPQKRAISVDEARASLARGAEELASIKEVIDNQEVNDLIDTTLADIDTLTATRETVFSALLDGRHDEAVNLNENGAAGVPAADAQAESVVEALDEVSTLTTASTELIYKEGQASASTSRSIALVAAVLAALIGFGFAFYIARGVRNAARAVVARLESLTNNCAADLERGILAVESGDLTVDARSVTQKIPDPANDELGQAGKAINSMLDKMVSSIDSYNNMRHGLGQIVAGVRSNATSILANSDALKEASDQVAAASNQIALAINEVAESATILATTSQESSQAVERLAAGSEEMAANAASNATSATQSRSEAAEIGERIEGVANASDEVAKSAVDSRTAAEEGKGAVQRAVASMESIAEAVTRASQTVDQLGEYGQTIGDIVKTIDEIAAQTNLLALNAAIEAARAGEQGRGFAVVAENVRSLAERSSQSTSEIADLIARVQAGTREAVQAMAAGVKDVESGREITNEAGVALETIITSVNESSTQMQAIARDVRALGDAARRIVESADGMAVVATETASAAGEMAESTSKVTEAVLLVSATSEETSASAEEVSASTEELSAQSEELAATANQMKMYANELNDAVARFKLAADNAAKPANIGGDLPLQRAA